MTRVKVFQSGNSQAVRLPKEFRVRSKELDIFRRGNELVLVESAHPMEKAFRLLSELPEDFLTDRQDAPPQKRKGLR